MYDVFYVKPKLTYPQNLLERLFEKIIKGATLSFSNKHQKIILVLNW